MTGALSPEDLRLINNTDDYKNEECEQNFQLVYQYAKKKDNEALKKLARDGVCLNTLALINHQIIAPISLLAIEGEDDAVYNFIAHFPCSSYQSTENAYIGRWSQAFAALGYAMANRVDKVNEFIKDLTGSYYVENAVLGYAIAGNFEEAFKFLKKDPYFVNILLKGFAAGGFTKDKALGIETYLRLPKAQRNTYAYKIAQVFEITYLTLKHEEERVDALMRENEINYQTARLLLLPSVQTWLLQGKHIFPYELFLKISAALCKVSENKIEDLQQKLSNNLFKSELKRLDSALFFSAKQDRGLLNVDRFSDGVKQAAERYKNRIN